MLLFPYEYVPSVFDIDYDALYRRGCRGLLFDIDNTLVHHGDDATPPVEALLHSLRERGFQILMLSNNGPARVSRFLTNIDAMAICNADKPKRRGFLQALTQMGLQADQAVCIGDQIFTDVLGANRCGIPSILVQFLQREGETKLGKRRRVERLILQCYLKIPSAQHRLGGIRK